MASVAGVEMKYALKKGSAWGTPVACGAGDGLLLLPTGVKQGDAALEVDDSQGLFWSQDGTPGPIKVDGDLSGYLRYDGLDRILAAIMGTAGVPSLHAGGAISYDYAYTLASHVDGIFWTFARHWKNYVEEVRSLKIAELTIKGERGKPLQFSAKCIGDAVAQDGTNTTTTFNNVTIGETAHRMHMAQGVFRMNDQGGAGLGSGDIIYPSSFEVTIKRNLAGVYSGQFTQNSRDVIDEPTNNGLPEVSVKLQFPRHSAKTRLTELGADTRKKLDITFTGGIIEGAIPRLFKLEFPNLQIRSVDIVDEAGIIKEPLDLVAHGCSTAPTGMSGITVPVKMSGTNKLASNPLA